jgi:dynein heavy chain, axonemal
LVKIGPNELNINLKNDKIILKSKSDHLESYFDEKIYKLIRETIAWKKLSSFGVVIPGYADDFVSSYKENLRTLREYVMLVVRDYNLIIDSFSEKIISEKKLFR